MIITIMMRFALSMIILGSLASAADAQVNSRSCISWTEKISERSNINVSVYLHSKCESEVSVTVQVFHDAKPTLIPAPVREPIKPGENWQFYYTMNGFGNWKFDVIDVTRMYNPNKPDTLPMKSSGQCDGENLVARCPTSIALPAHPPGSGSFSATIGPNSKAEICLRHPAGPDGKPVMPKAIYCYHHPIDEKSPKNCPMYRCTFNTECGDVIFNGGRVVKVGSDYDYCVTMNSGPNGTFGVVDVKF